MDNSNGTIEKQHDKIVAPESSENESSVTISRSRRKAVTLSDVITFQAIICVLLSIAYMAANMLFPDISEEIYNEYIFSVSAEAPVKNMGELAKAVIDFLNSTPREYDRA